MNPSDGFKFAFAKKKEWKQVKGEGQTQFDTFGNPILGADGKPEKKYDMKWVETDTGEFENQSQTAKDIRAYYGVTETSTSTPGSTEQLSDDVISKVLSKFKDGVSISQISATLISDYPFATPEYIQNIINARG